MIDVVSTTAFALRHDAVALPDLPAAPGGAVSVVIAMTPQQLIAAAQGDEVEQLARFADACAAIFRAMECNIPLVGHVVIHAAAGLYRECGNVARRRAWQLLREKHPAMAVSAAE